MTNAYKQLHNAQKRVMKICEHITSVSNSAELAHAIKLLIDYHNDVKSQEEFYANLKLAQPEKEKEKLKKVDL